MNPVYKTSDGEEYATQKEAKAHQRRIDAISNHEKAREELLHAMAGCLKTADGALFEYGDYFYLREWFPHPDVVRLSMLGAYWQKFEVASDGTLGIVVDRDFDGRRDTTVFRIHELYKSETAAYAALAKCAAHRIEQYKEELADIRKRAKLET